MKFVYSKYTVHFQDIYPKLNSLHIIFTRLENVTVYRHKYVTCCKDIRKQKKNSSLGTSYKNITTRGIGTRKKRTREYTKFRKSTREPGRRGKKKKKKK